MVLSIRHNWRLALAAFIVLGAFGPGRVLAVGAQKEGKESKLLVVAADGRVVAIDAPKEDKESKAVLADKLERMGAEIKELRAAGKLEEAERLTLEARELKQKLQRFAETGEKQPKAIPAELLERLKAMQHEAAELREAGRHEQAEKIMREVAELKERHAWMIEGKGKGKPTKKFEPDAKLEARIVELKQAIEKSHDAGRIEEVQELKRELERTADELNRLRKKHGEPAHDKFAAAHPPKELAQAVEKLRHEVDRLRDEVADLRRVVKEREEKPGGEKGGKKGGQKDKPKFGV